MVDRTLKSLQFPQISNVKYLIPQTDPSLTVSGAAADAKKTGEEISYLKEDLTQLQTDMENGNFPETAVGSADQLISDNYVVENEPYQFRKSGGSADIGTRMEDAIVGGSIVWNQLILSGDHWRCGSPYTNISINSDNNTVTATIASNDFNYVQINATNIPLIINGHKYLYGVNIQPNLTGDNSLIRGTTQLIVIKDGVKQRIYFTPVSGYNTGVIEYSGETISDFDLQYQLYTSGIMGEGESITLSNCVLFDLTAMFGTEIADYIYSLEQANQGDGVAWFKKLFPNDYYEYNEGELMSVSGLSEHKTVGFNVWDEEWEAGGINGDNGNNINLGNFIRSTHYIKVFPGTIYYINSSTYSECYIFFYDHDKNYKRYWMHKNDNFTPMDGEGYIRISLNAGTTYNHDICINLSDPTRNGEYEPYQSHSYPLDDSLTLRGIPKLDSNNQLYFDGDRYLASGVVERRYGIVDLGTLNWSLAEDHVFYNSEMENKARKNQGVFCSKYANPYTRNIKLSNMTDKTVQNRSDTDALYIKDSDYSDAAAFKTAMSGVYLVYELATPTTEQATPYHNPQIVDPEGTEEYICTSLVPVGHETKYFEDLKGKIEGLPSNFATLIADTEKTFKATKNYAQGDYLIVNNQLYKVSSAITSGSTITPGTNVTATTIMAEIMALA